jgi:CO/xanthine dehydrogenase Mo-binding subunit
LSVERSRGASLTRLAGRENIEDTARNESYRSGYALPESLPPFEGGPGNGQWNLGQYLIARGADLPLRDLDIEVLPPLTPNEPPKGMAEVVMIPVVPALLNAIFDATGRRFRALPVTQSVLKGALS